MAYLNISIFDGVLGWIELLLKGQTGYPVGSIWHQKDGEFELSNNFTFLLVEDLERYDELVGHALNDAHLGLGLAVQAAQVERHGTEFLVDRREKFPGISVKKI